MALINQNKIINTMRDRNLDIKTIRGLAIVFDTPALIQEGKEQIREILWHGCLRSTDMSDVVLNYNHQAGGGLSWLAGTRNNTLDLKITPYGLEVTANLVTEIPTRAYVFEAVNDRALVKMSFQAIINPGDCIWSMGDNGIRIKTVMRIERLLDVSLVDRPAYEKTTVNTLDGYERTRREKEEMDLVKAKLRMM